MSNIKIHVLQHEPFEGAGLIEDWAHEKGLAIQITFVYDNEPLPAVNSFDWLVIMGGGMSANDENKYAWIKPEKILIKKAIEAGKTVLGICLGSQMIASALGKRVFKNEVKEIGWWPLQLTPQGLASQWLTNYWSNQLFFHWHGETFDLPDGAVHLAVSEGCSNQAFSIRNHVFGFQFHPETNMQTLTQMVSAGASELVKSRYVMPGNEILSIAGNIQFTSHLFNRFLDKILLQFDAAAQSK